MNDKHFRQLLDELGYSWQGYRRVRKGVIKRLVHHMRQLDIRDVDGYLQRIRSEPDIRREARRLMTVSISRFFRDPPVWNCIETKLVPELLSRGPAVVTAWFAGCSLGQEVYSFKMLWLLLENQTGPLPQLSLTATDVNPEYLNMAAAGVYRDHIIKEIPGKCLERFFRRDRGLCLLAEDVKRDISWQRHDLTGPAPMKGPFHMIFMRNSLLTYCKEEFRGSHVGRLSESLAPRGYLIIGAREEMPADVKDLYRVDDCPCVFRKR